MKKLNVGFVGLGKRGRKLMQNGVLPWEGAVITAVCDLFEDRTQEAVNIITEAGQAAPFVTACYHELLAQPGLDAVIISTGWEPHIEIACAAMRAGVYAGLEVGGTYSMDDCWRLVRTYEETGVPCMLLENCCYGRDELMVLNMARQGVFGELVHCQGGYRHDIRSEVTKGVENRHYRMRNYVSRNCENYPTHELGPLAQLLDINRGNRMLTLNSVASKAVGLKAYAKDNYPPEHPANNIQFAQGDVVTTIIKCARGETIVLTLDTTLPRHYSRGYHVQGTKGLYMEDNQSVFLDGDDHDWRPHWGNADKYREKYEHPIWQKYLSEGVKEGHGGIDWLVVSAFLDAAKAKAPTPIDVYDTASWMSISCLSEESILAGGAPVAIPDFTNGKWLRGVVD